MRRSRASSGVLANPVLVGAVTVLVTLVAVFLAYNANAGLPFVPTTTYKVHVSNGANLVPGNEVRSGGYRIGVIDDMQPITLPNEEVGVELSLKLDKTVGDVPVDSTLRIRPRSALGLKYLELTEGRSDRSFRDGDTIALEATSRSIELDEVLGMFDAPTREGARRSLQGFGDSFASRGTSLGLTIEQLPRLFGHLEPVMRNLSDPDTDLRSFFKELGDTARVIAPVADTQARLFTTMADTFEAIGRDEGALKDFISKSPPTMDVAIDSFRVQRPFLTEFADFSEDFAGATQELRGALPSLNRAVARGIGAQRRAVALNERLMGSLAAVRRLVEAPPTMAALRGLTATVATLNPQLRFYGPYVTVCNSWNYFWTFVSEHLSEPDSTGFSQRALINFTGRQDDSIGSMGANSPARGQGVIEGAPQYMHGQDLAHAVLPNGEADCENGQRGFLERQARFVPKGPDWKIARDPRNPGAQGPTFKGRPRVPKGLTFTDLPETGPYKDLPASESGDR